MTLTDMSVATPVVAVDPGKSGAVVRLCQGKLEARRDFKTLDQIADAIREFAGAALFVIEHVHAFPGEGVRSCFNFGKAAGVAFGAAFGCQPPPVEVQPWTWQHWFKKRLGIPEEVKFKAVVREVAAKIFPGYKELFRRSKDHNTADATCIAVYGLANFQQLTAQG